MLIFTNRAEMPESKDHRQNVQVWWWIIQGVETSVDLGAERYFALDWEPRPRVSYRFFPFEIDILRGTEIPCKRNAIEVLANFAFVDWNVVEQSQKQSEKTHNQNYTYPD